MSTLKWVRTYLYTRERIHGLFYEYLEMGQNMREGIHGLFYEYLEMGKNTREGIHGLFYEYLEMGQNVFGHEGGDSRAVL